MNATPACRRLGSLLQRVWALLIACAILSIMPAGNAYAHGPAAFQDQVQSLAQTYLPMQVGQSGKPGTADSRHNACPCGATHAGHLACASGSACHAVALGFDSAIESRAGLHAYGRRASGAPRGLNIPPPIHPPNT